MLWMRFGVFVQTEKQTEFNLYDLPNHENEKQAKIGPILGIELYLSNNVQILLNSVRFK